MFHPVLGRFLSRDPLPTDGETVLMGTGIDRINSMADEWDEPTNGERINLYAYVENNPTNYVDPSGLKHGSPGGRSKPRIGPPCMFFVRKTDLRGSAVSDVCLRTCGVMHFDLASTCDGVLRVGVGGERDRMVGGPLGMGSNDIGLKRSNTGNMWGRAGDGTGKSCKDATNADIANCVNNRPPKGPGGKVTNNCRDDVTDTANACCLTGVNVFGNTGLWPGKD